MPALICKFTEPTGSVKLSANILGVLATVILISEFEFSLIFAISAVGPSKIVPSAPPASSTISLRAKFALEPPNVYVICTTLKASACSPIISSVNHSTSTIVPVLPPP
jgi:hypothetical protein